MRRVLIAIGLALALTGCGGGRGPAKAVYAFNDDAGSWLALRSLDGGEERALTESRRGRWDTSPAWSPDGKTVLFRRSRSAAGGGEVFLVDADGSHLRRLRTGRIAPAGAWWDARGDGILLETDGAARGVDFYRVRVDGSGLRRVARVAGPGRGGSFEDVELSPDATRVAVVRWLRAPGRWWDDPFGPALLEVARADGAGTRTILRAPVLGQVAWSADGSRIAYLRDCGYGEDACILGVVDIRTGVRREVATHADRGADTGDSSRFYEDDPRVPSIAWRPGRDTVLYTRHDAVREVDPTTGATRVLARLRCPGSSCAYTSARVLEVSRDGRRAALAVDFEREGEPDNPWEATATRWGTADLETAAVRLAPTVRGAGDEWTPDVAVSLP